MQHGVRVVAGHRCEVRHVDHDLDGRAGRDPVVGVVGEGVGADEVIERVVGERAVRPEGERAVGHAVVEDGRQHARRRPVVAQDADCDVRRQSGTERVVAPVRLVAIPDGHDRRVDHLDRDRGRCADGEPVLHLVLEGVCARGMRRRHAGEGPVRVQRQIGVVAAEGGRDRVGAVVGVIGEYAGERRDAQVGAGRHRVVVGTGDRGVVDHGQRHRQ